MHRFWTVSSPEYDGGVADDNQHASGSVALCHVYWAHLHPYSLSHIVIQILQCKSGIIIPYSWKYWWELNLVVEPKIAIARILADLNLAVRYRIAIRIYASRKFWRILIWQL